ncbi:ribokinase [Margalitia sp. FSL K6-0131]|uniref:ribokinase n=1 Tax=Margalitia sp. FSL K6-0131 TaxID=2954604 RepID=UPI0030F9F7C7
MKRIVVVGSLNMDLVTTVRSLPKPGETVASTSFATIPGGKGANQAVCAARLGAQVKMIGKVGSDEYGSQLISILEESGVDSKGVYQNGKTGMAFIQVSEDGENSIVLYPGANGEITPQEIEYQKQIIENGDFILLQLEIPCEAVSHTLKLANSLGKKVILNPAPARILPDEWYPMIHTLTPNETELSILTKQEIQTKEDVIRSAKILMDKGAKQIIVTMGKKGAYFIRKNVHTHIPAYSVPTVDSTGAGDSFTAAFTFALAQGKEEVAAAQFASKVASMVVQRKGAIPSMPYGHEVEK